MKCCPAKQQPSISTIIPCQIVSCNPTILEQGKTLRHTICATLHFSLCLLQRCKKYIESLQCCILVFRPQVPFLFLYFVLACVWYFLYPVLSLCFHFLIPNSILKLQIGFANFSWPICWRRKFVILTIVEDKSRSNLRTYSILNLY